MNKSIFIISLDTESIWGYNAYPFHDDITMIKMMIPMEEVLQEAETLAL